MPRPRKAIPSRLEGRGSIASVLETCSADAAELAGRLRKPASLVKNPSLFLAIDELNSAAQALSDLSVEITLGHVDILEAEGPRETQLPMVIDAVGNVQLALPFDVLEAAVEN